MKAKTETPWTDAAEERARQNYEMSRECGDPAYPGSDMADDCRRLERAMREAMTELDSKALGSSLMAIGILAAALEEKT